MSDKKLTLTRRKALMGLGGIGTGAALGGTGTMAFLNDQETSQDNMMTAGTLDLQLDWYTFYKGQDTETNNTANNGGNGPVFDLGDVKPGDYGCGVVGVHVDGNPAHIWFRTNNAEEGEGDYTEPEEIVDDSEHEGELAEHVKFVTAPLDCIPKDEYDGETTVENNLPYESGSRPSMDEWTTDEEVAEANSSKNYCYTKGTLADLLYGGDCGTYLPSEEDETCLYGFCWWIPKRVGNEIQGDWVEFDLEFYAEQKRHNSDPNNPWASGNIALDTDDSPGTEYNDQGSTTRPYITWEGGDNEATFTFHNPTDFTFSFDYRVDGEYGEEDDYTDMTIGEGPLADQTFGKRYNSVTVGPNDEETVHVAACETIDVILRRGAEQNWYIPWIRFDIE